MYPSLCCCNLNSYSVLRAFVSIDSINLKLLFSPLFFSVICCTLLLLLLFSPNLFYRTVGFLLFRSYHLSILLSDRNSFLFFSINRRFFRADLVPVAKLACPLPFPRTVFRSAVSFCIFLPHSAFGFFSFRIIGIMYDTVDIGTLPLECYRNGSRCYVNSILSHPSPFFQYDLSTIK
jgi:hypothetical protein